MIGLVVRALPLIAKVGAKVLKSPMGRGAVGGFMAGKAVGRNQQANQGLRDGQQMSNWFPGGGQDGTMY